MRYSKSQRNMKYVLAGGSIVAALGLLVDPHTLLKTKVADNLCQEVIAPQTTLSRQKLSRLLAVPERASRQEVRKVLKEPYCRLPNLEVRAGAVAQREAYPLEFDSQTWLVVLYEGNEYAGYDFSFRR